MEKAPSQAQDAILNPLEAFLRNDPAKKLPTHLTEADIATLKHLAQQGLGKNSLRALTSDLAYIQAWALSATGSPLPWPAPEWLIAKFIAHHLWDPAERNYNATHGMPDIIMDDLKKQGFLRASGPHAPATVQRRLSSWSTLTQWRGDKGMFNTPSLRSALKLAVRASQRRKTRKSPQSITGDILQKLIQNTNDTKLSDLRDRALLLASFAAGGRRRSEMAMLCVEQLTHEQPVLTNPADNQSPLLTCLTLQPGRTKTTTAEAHQTALLMGAPAEALLRWLEAAKITAGPIFRPIDQWGHVHARSLDPQSVNLIVKKWVIKAGLDPRSFTAHGLRSGYLTQAARLGISLPEAMQQSGHKSVQQAANYYNDAERKQGRAARIFI